MLIIKLWLKIHKNMTENIFSKKILSIKFQYDKYQDGNYTTLNHEKHFEVNFCHFLARWIFLACSAISAFS